MLRPALALAFSSLIVFFSIVSHAEDTKLIETAAPKAEATEATNRVVIKTETREFVVEDPESTSPIYKPFAELEEEQKKEFKTKRVAFLKAATRALSAMKYGFGVGVIVRDSLSYRVERMMDRLHLAHIHYYFPKDVSETLKAAYRAEMLKKAEEQQEKTKKALRERANAVIEGSLKSIDQQLWVQAPLFAKSNEFGVMLAAGVQAQGGTKDRFKLGGLIDLGISLGYNHDTHAIAFQIFRDVEGFRSTIMGAVGVAGFVGKAGMYVGNQKPQGGLEHEGSTFYPPMVPGFSTVTRDSFAVGVSSGLTIPPSPFGDILTYTNHVDQKVLIRVTVSPLSKGYVRVQFGNILSATKFIVEPVLSGIRFIQSITTRKGMCAELFVKPAAI